MVLGFVIVSVSVAVVLIWVEATLNDFVIVGGGTTTTVAEAVVPVPSFVELTVPVVFAFDPAVVPVTLTETAQVAPGVEIEPPVRLMLVALATGEKVPPQVLVAPGVAETVNPVGKVSLTAMPFIAPVSFDGSVMVRVRVVEPVSGIVGAPNALVIVGGAVTFNDALAVNPVPPLVALTAPVVFEYVPTVAESTFTEIAQLLLAATVPRSG